MLSLLPWWVPCLRHFISCPMVTQVFLHVQNQVPHNQSVPESDLSLRTTKASCLSGCPVWPGAAPSSQHGWMHFILWVCILSLCWSCGFEFFPCTPHELFIHFQSSPGNRALKKPQDSKFLAQQQPEHHIVSCAFDYLVYIMGSTFFHHVLSRGWFCFSLGFWGILGF